MCYFSSIIKIKSNNVLYSQIDGVGMGNPFRQTLANALFCHEEIKSQSLILYENISFGSSSIQKLIKTLMNCFTCDLPNLIQQFCSVTVSDIWLSIQYRNPELQVIVVLELIRVYTFSWSCICSFHHTGNARTRVVTNAY